MIVVTPHPAMLDRLEEATRLIEENLDKGCTDIMPMIQEAIRLHVGLRRLDLNPTDKERFTSLFERHDALKDRFIKLGMVKP